MNRSEIKYLVPDEALPALRHAIAPMVSLDKYCKDYEETGYTVRSIYLDTPQLQFYHEKLAGIKKRIKLRIRGYNTLTSNTQVFLEIKRKDESKIFKDRAAIPFDQLDQLLDPAGAAAIMQYFHARADTPRDRTMLQYARNFFFHVHRTSAQRINLVVYEREAFECRINPGLRITFDKNLRARLDPALSELYSEEELHGIIPGHFILEIKYNYTFPDWITPILAQFKLQKESLSKYVMGLERCAAAKDGDGMLKMKSRYYLNNRMRSSREMPIEKKGLEKTSLG